MAGASLNSGSGLSQGVAPQNLQTKSSLKGSPGPEVHGPFGGQGSNSGVSKFEAGARSGASIEGASAASSGGNGGGGYVERDRGTGESATGKSELTFQSKSKKRDKSKAKSKKRSSRN